MIDGIEYIEDQIKLRQGFIMPFAVLCEGFPVNIGDDTTTIIINLTEDELELLKSGRMLINSGHAMYNYVIRLKE